MFFKSIKIKNFSKTFRKSSSKNLISSFKKFIHSNNNILLSMKNNYKDSYNKKLILDLKKFKNVNLIGMGGSSLGAKAIYSFLGSKKKFYFFDNFSNFKFKQNDKKNINIIISKSGNTLETISNSNILIKKSKKNIFVTENKKNYLMSLANKLKAEVVHHNNFIFRFI
jgi:glucose-6-phosphate isomerase